MADLSFSIDIAAPPKEIFVFFVPQRMPHWYGIEMNAKFEVQGGAPDFALGQKVRISGDLGSYQVVLTVVITAYEWERLLEWQFQDSYGVRGKQRWELQSVAVKTQLTMRDNYQMPSAFGRFFDKIFTRFAVTQRDRAWLARLQQLAERR
jgi:polyketide cyclase/dehydrase/lipid transport protein